MITEKHIFILTMVRQWTKYSRYWISCRMIRRIRLTNRWMIPIRNSEPLKRSNLLTIQTMRVFWHQKQMSVLLLNGSHTKELETNKNRKKTEEDSPITWKRNVSPHSRENFLLEGGFFYQFDESTSVFDVYEQVINRDVLN